MTRLELLALQDRYVSAIDNDRIEDWPGFFTDECLYEVIPRENEEMGLPAPVLYCDNIRMLRDRVTALRHANIYERPAYRHCLSGMEWTARNGGFDVRTSYVVVNTSLVGDSAIYQAGRYEDHVVRTPDGLRFRSKRCIYDTLRVQRLLAFPV